MASRPSPGQPSSRRAARACPVCERPAAAAHAPFCSARCKDVVLNRWLQGAYVIPGRAEDEAGGPARAGDADDAPEDDAATRMHRPAH